MLIIFWSNPNSFIWTRTLNNWQITVTLPLALCIEVTRNSLWISFRVCNGSFYSICQMYQLLDSIFIFLLILVITLYFHSVRIDLLRHVSIQSLRPYMILPDLPLICYYFLSIWGPWRNLSSICYFLLSLRKTSISRLWMNLLKLNILAQ